MRLSYHYWKHCVLLLLIKKICVGEKQEIKRRKKNFNLILFHNLFLFDYKLFEFSIMREFSIFREKQPHKKAI
jgi:hypothetical protein